ncbi:MAG: tetratricopeptide repeat protein, partial [Thermodesulfovibrionales bacterium]|nr:tetratricopeptide repeat protein [Thermodesulfovibrionales bacterium]
SYKAYVSDKSNKVLIFSPAKVVDPSGIALVNIRLVKVWLDDVSYNLFIKDNKNSIYQVKHLISYSQMHNIAIISIETQGQRLEQTDKLTSNGPLNDFIISSINKYKQGIKKATTTEDKTIASLQQPTFETPKDTTSIRSTSTIKEPHQYIEIAKILIKEKKLAEAEENLNEAFKIDKNNKDALMIMAQIYTSTGRFKEAEILYKKAYELNNSREVMKKLGSLYIITGQYKESIRQLQIYLNHNPLDADAQFTLALNYLFLGDKESAFNQYIKLKKINSTKSEELFDLLYR